MKDNKKQYWKNAITSMDPENQLELVELLIEELGVNEEVLTKEDGYDTDISSKLRLILEEYADETNKKTEKKEILSLLKKFEKLSPAIKGKVINLIIPEFLSVMEDVMKKDTVSNCIKEGHAYDENSWERNEWTTYETVYRDREACPNYPIEHVSWSRKCPKCGFVETVTTEPLEVKVQREGEERRIKIHKLQKELNKLQGEQTK